MTLPTVVLTRSDVAALLSLEECIEAVEGAFRAYAEGRTLQPGVLSVHAEGGAFHIKAAGTDRYFAAKTNGNFFHNDRLGLPRILGTMVLCDARNGMPLAILDSIEITIRRTGAATGVAAKHLARRDASVATVIGCGNQGRVSVEAIRAVRSIETLFVFDVDRAKAQALAAETGGTAVAEFRTGTIESDIIVTCTPAREAFLRREHLKPGAFVAAVGADSDEKLEIDPALMASSRVFGDHLEQCASIGDLRGAIAAGVMQREDAAGEIGAVIAGQLPGRRSEEEIVIFDSTGSALQDVAAAAIVYEKALLEGRGTPIRLSA